MGISALLFLGMVLGGQIAYADSPCVDPGNLTYNCGFDSFQSTPKGEVGEGWWPFVEMGSPRFERDPVESPQAPAQKIWTDGVPFIAGVYQQVGGVTPGTAYLAAVEWFPFQCHKDGEHLRGDFIGRKIGVDPTGGTDPTSPAIVWSPEVWEEWEIRREVPEMRASAVAQGDTVTVFVRVNDSVTHGKDEVWIDFVGLIPDPVQPEPTSTPVPSTSTPTETPLPPTPAPTPPPMPPTDTPVATPTTTISPTPMPTFTSTPTPTLSPSPTRVEVAPEEEEPEPAVAIQEESGTTSKSEPEASEIWGYLFLGIAIAGFGGAGILGVLAFWIWRR